MKLIQQPVKTTAVNIAVQETITTWSLVIVIGGKLLWLSRRSDCVFTKVWRLLKKSTGWRNVNEFVFSF